MFNLRLSSLTVVDSTHIIASFTENLHQTIGISNISILPQLDSLPIPVITSLTIDSNNLIIETQPLTVLAPYIVTFQSTQFIIFKSLNGDAVLYEDGVSNAKLIIGPIENNNSIKRLFNEYFDGNVYNLDDGTVVSNILTSLSLIYSKALYDIRQVKNENYIDYTITDELKVRSDGPSDRLTQESAYEVLRVSKNKLGDLTHNKLNFNEFKSNIITLLATESVEQLTIDNEDIIGALNINSLLLNLKHYFTTKVNSLNIISNGIVYTYDLSKYGYYLLDSKYDPDNCFTYYSIKTNQVRLSEKFFSDNNIKLSEISNIQITYEYKDNQKQIIKDSIKVYSIFQSVREVLPPLKNTFNLLHAPIVDANGNVATLSNVDIYDPNQLSNKHPAFIEAIEFDTKYLPFKQGQYTIDPETGMVFVFGKDYKNDGTGDMPPLLTYNYKYIYKENIDYVYDDESFDLNGLEIGNIIGNNVVIEFDYENVLAKNIDYKANIHKESLSERINNKLIGYNIAKVENIPITSVFQVFNETTGEIYKIDRWTNNYIYFSGKTAPKIIDEEQELVSFYDVSNEIISVFSSTLISGLFVIKCFLKNNNIMSATQDTIGSSFNSSVSLSNTHVFKNEIYFDTSVNEQVNLLRLNADGKYFIDYVNGILYASLSSVNDLGSISYKKSYIKTNNKHVLKINDIYYKYSVNYPKIKQVDYNSFGDDYISLRSIDVSNQLYYLSSSAVYDNTFSLKLFDFVKDIRSIYEKTDLINNKLPIDFSQYATISNKTIYVNKISKQEYSVVKFDGVNYYVDINTPIAYQSPNITFNFSIKRQSSSEELYNLGAISLNEDNSTTKVIVSQHSPITNEFVIIDYSFEINNLSAIIMDYSFGDLFVDYSYLFDEILVSYEYGDNCIDFRESSALATGEQYYVTYKIGALRKALLNNFGSMLDISILNTFDLNFDREKYRDSIKAVFHSFSKGPTNEALKDIVKTITHTPCEIIELAEKSWLLGSNLLSKQNPVTYGDIVFKNGKFDNGIYFDNSCIQISSISNVKLSEGTIQFWLIPNWDGIDNSAPINVKILKNNLPISANDIYIGDFGFHPIIVDNKFTLDKSMHVMGSPSKNRNGIYIYLSKEVSGNLKWFIDVVDSGNNIYSINVDTDGEFFNVVNNVTKLTSTKNNISLTVDSSILHSSSISMFADYERYFFDCGENKTKDRLSIYKDSKGYLSFRVYDKYSNVYVVTKNISSWKKYEQHHIAASWNLNTVNKKDEIHLFIDGQEVENIVKYDPISNINHNVFKSISSDEFLGYSSKAIISSNDLSTISGSNHVTSTSNINFTAYGILAGDTLYIDELGFNPLGYVITSVLSNVLILNSNMPASLNNVKYSINKQIFTSQIDPTVYSKIAVWQYDNYAIRNATISSNTNVINVNTTSINVNDFVRVVTNDIDVLLVVTSIGINNITVNYTFANNYTTQVYLYSSNHVEISGVNSLNPKYIIDGNKLTILYSNKNSINVLKTFGLSSKKVLKNYYVWGNSSNYIQTNLPTPISLSSIKINHILLQNTLINSSNTILNSGHYEWSYNSFPGLSDSEVGRTISFRISTNNINLTATPLSIDITGQVNGANHTETLIFDSINIKSTTSKFQSISNVLVRVSPISIAKSFLTIEIKEEKSILENQGASYTPIIRFSYPLKAGTKLYKSGSQIKDDSRTFSVSDVGNSIYISSPLNVQGYYTITNISYDKHSLSTNPVVSNSFTNGAYQVLNVLNENSGLQNGKFIFEKSNEPGTPYLLKQGLYEFEYYTDLSIEFDNVSKYSFIGSDYSQQKYAYGIIDELKISSIKYHDTRIGEVIDTKSSITSNYNSLKPLNKDNNTLMLLRLNSLPILNEADSYISGESKNIYSGISVNDNFGKSMVIKNDPLILNNLGVLDTKKEATIEFWVSPLYDTTNDPFIRFYFDASAMVSEKCISESISTVKISGKASQVLSVHVQGDDTEYFANGIIDDDNQTILLNKDLPNQSTYVVVNYIPLGANGDRVSIYKDVEGYINFNIRADNVDYQVRSHVFWLKNTWHRIKASYKINQGRSIDEFRLFIDGYEKGSARYGQNLLFGQGAVYGISSDGQENNIKANINFKDTVNEIFIGSDYSQTYHAYAAIDNLRISNLSRPIYKPYNESIDVNYNSNISAAYPVTEDLYTTLLFDFSSVLQKIDNFAILMNPGSGLNRFIINVYDAFGIIKNDAKMESVITTLINTLKPADSKALIRYI